MRISEGIGDISIPNSTACFLCLTVVASGVILVNLLSLLFRPQVELQGGEEKEAQQRYQDQMTAALSCRRCKGTGTVNATESGQETPKLRQSEHIGAPFALRF